MEGMKYDEKKPRWDLMASLWKQFTQVVDVLTFGANKYSDDNWQKINKSRYEAASFRHLTAYCGGEKNDPETGKSHLAHCICCLLFMMWMD